MRSRTRCRCRRASTCYGQRMPLMTSFCCIMVLIQLNACTPTVSRPAEVLDGVVHPDIELTSPAFSDGSYLPKKYSRSGGNVSPPLKWNRVPLQTRSFVLVCSTPDGSKSLFTHWLIYNIPAEIRELPKGAFASGKKAFIGIPGKNNFRNQGYDGPDPPSGMTYRYYFTLYALDITLDLQPGARNSEVLDAMRGHVLAEGRLMGRYRKEIAEDKQDAGEETPTSN